MAEIVLVGGCEAYSSIPVTRGGLELSLSPNREHNVRLIGDGSNSLTRAQVSATLKDVLQQDKPTLVFALAQARSESGFGRQMMGFYGSSHGDEPKEFLREVIEASKGRKTPVEVFMMLARRPDFVRDMVHDLPENSVVAAVHVPRLDVKLREIGSPDKGRSWHFLHALRDYREQIAVAPTARTMLGLYLAQCPDKPLSHPLPVIEISKKVLPDFMGLVKQGKVPDTAAGYAQALEAGWDQAKPTWQSRYAEALNARLASMVKPR